MATEVNETVFATRPISLAVTQDRSPDASPHPYPDPDPCAIHPLPRRKIVRPSCPQRGQRRVAKGAVGLGYIFSHAARVVV